MITIAHLMDDFGMGGVTRALTLVDQPIKQNLARSSVISVSKNTRTAPKIEAELIVDHATLSWARLQFLASLRARNQRARIVHVGVSFSSQVSHAE